MTEESKQLTPAMTAVFPAPGMAAPTQFSFTQDDRHVLFLRSTAEDPVQQLYSLDAKTGEKQVWIAPPDGGIREENLSLEEELRRQRERMLAVGITHYSLAERSQRIMVPISGSIYVQDAPGEALRLVYDGAQGAALNPAISADGAWIAFVRDGEVYVLAAEGGTPQQITQGARGTGKTNGLPDYIAQEELGRYQGFWWSPDAQNVAYTEVDETHIPVYRIMHQGKDFTGDGAQEDHHYPFAGAENPRVRLAVTGRDGDGANPVWMDLDFGEEIYLVQVFWWQDGALGAVVVNRPQDKMWLVAFDITTGERKTIWQESSAYWINASGKRHGDKLWLLEEGGFILASERSGFNHLYLHGADGGEVRALTQGDWVVDGIAAVDEANGVVYFTAGKDVVIESHLYQVTLEGGAIKRITTQPGMHTVTLNHACDLFVDEFSAVDTPPTVTLCRLSDGVPVFTIHIPNDPRLEAQPLPPPEFVTLQNRHGETLYGAVYCPPEAFGLGPHPTIVHVYGGPGPQMVQNSWRTTSAMQLQYLRQQGFLVFRLDNRGSARRGLEFEGALKHRMGTIEVEDQVDGVNWLVAQGLTDPACVGVFGWSYGGYMTLMCLAKAGDVFKMGVSGAPVTHWDGYDTAYTERYMGTPQENPDGYKTGSVMEYVTGIRGKLLLVHGLLDENVHFRHTARLINALTRANIPYDLLLFPDERHMPRREADRTTMNTRIFQYFADHL